MISADVWMPFYVADYLKDTGHLGHAEHGCYLLLLAQSWTMGPLPSDEVSLSRLARCPIREWRKIAPVVLAFFETQDGKLISPRLERERARATSLTQGRSKAGAIGAAKRWQRDGKRMAEPLANASQIDGPSPSPSQKEEERKNSEATPPPPDGALMKPPVESLDGHDVGPPPIGQDARDVLWREGLPRLQRLTGKTGFQARSMLGKFLRDARDDCALVSSILHECEAGRFLDPIPWITAAILSRTGQRGSHGPPSKLGWMMEPNVVENLMSIGRKQ